MRVAYVTRHRSSNVEAWSGLNHHIRRALSLSGCHIDAIDNLSGTPSLISAAKRLYYEKIALKSYSAEREPLVLRSYATQVQNALASLDCDVVFSPGTLPLAYLETDTPMVFWTDSTFAGMVDFYPGFTNLCEANIKQGNYVEQEALNRCCLAIYSSEWAASTALRHYAVDARKVKVVPFGANVDGLQSPDEVARVTRERSAEVCRLLFVGVDWIRKAGDFAVSVAELLNRQGVPTELNVVGCSPPREVPAYVKVHGYLSKAHELGARRLRRLFSECHFLLHPSRAECFGLALAEASAFALPSLAARVGGTASVVTDGVNGRLFGLDDAADAYCAYIRTLFASRDEYLRAASAAFREYAERLNWTVAGKHVCELIEEAIPAVRQMQVSIVR
jgi:hypothetical protein